MLRRERRPLGALRAPDVLCSQMNPIVIAYHLIWTVYGWWLPNDLRGSTSREIRWEKVAAITDGEIHFGRRKVQPASRDVRAFYEQAAKALRYPLLEVRDKAVELVATAFAEVISHQRYTCYACAIMPDHVHMIIRKHKHCAEEMIELLQNAARWKLNESHLWPSDHPVWTRGGWSVFLDHPNDVERTIPYIEDNPKMIGLAVQRWPFVVPYDRWPLHEGHSENSPYVKRLRAVGRYP
jgi:REP element-mobilizing transposase RayT